MAGQRLRAAAIIRETTDGTFHYDLTMDAREAGVLHNFSRAIPTAGTDPASALDGSLADINIPLLPETGNEPQPAPPLSVERLPDLAADRGGAG